MKILQKDNKILRRTAEEVAVKDIKTKKIKDILKKMTEALRKSDYGVALAAPQVGESLRFFIVAGEAFLKELGLPKKPEQKLKPIIFINPIIKKVSKKKQILAEGCLSVEGLYGTIKRAEKLTVEAYDENAKKFTRGASGLLAQIIQHEIDHLNGVLFTDKAGVIQKIEHGK